MNGADTVISIFGDVEPEAALALVEKHLGAMPHKDTSDFSVPQPQPATPAQLVQTITQKPLGAVQIGFGPGVTRTSPDYPAIEVMTNVLSRFPTGWLEQQLRGEGEGLVYAVGCGQFTGFAPGYVAILFNATPEKLPQALERTTHVVQRIQGELVDDQTLVDAKAAVLSAELLARQSNSERAAQFSLDELYGLGLNETERFIGAVKALSAEQLRTTARTYLKTPLTVVLTHEALPEAELHKAIEGLTPVEP